MKLYRFLLLSWLIICPFVMEVKLVKAEPELERNNPVGDLANSYTVGDYFIGNAAIFFGQGDNDYAKIKNFTKGKHMIILAGNSNEYQWESIDGNVRISTSSGDLVAIVEAIDNLEVEEVYEDVGIFILK